MSRSSQWRRTCSDLVFWRQTQALNATIYILRETGPTGFLLKEEGEAKPCKAFLGDPHSCTCTQFMKDRDLCKHICWLLLKKFRVPQTDPMSWQKGLVEREINNILRGLATQQRKKVPTAISRWRRPLSADSDAKEVIPQRDIDEDDVCPICQDELLSKRLPVTYCKFGCGNSIHIKCMKVWADHQKTQGETTVKCPFCREDFGPFELLKSESRNATGPVQGGRMDRHIGMECQSCHVFPIEGKCYRCSSCANFNLCQTCFNTPIHTQHAFEFRHKRNQRWRPAQRAYGAVLPQAVVDDLLNRDITDNDYDLLMQLDSNTQASTSEIPESVIQTFPQEKVRENGPLLAPGMQCRVCLRGYQVGQLIRKLPRCKHKFHKDCIDNWLLHSKPTCPVDGTVVWDPVTAQVDTGNQQNRNRQQRQTRQGETVVNSMGVNLEVPGVGLTLRTQDINRQQQQQQQQQQSRGVRGRPPIHRHRDRENRETERVLGLRSSFALSGNAVGQGDEMGTLGYRGALPGGRLMNRINHRREIMAHQLQPLSNGHTEDNDPDFTDVSNGVADVQEGLVTTAIGVEEEDPLEQVIAANDLSNQNPPQHSHNPGPANVSSLFSSSLNAQPDVTSTLLTNIQRISSYEENPNLLETVAEVNHEHPTPHPHPPLHLHPPSPNQDIEETPMEIESTRTSEVSGNIDLRTNHVQRQSSQPRHSGINVLSNPTNILFADNPSRTSASSQSVVPNSSLFSHTVPSGVHNNHSIREVTDNHRGGNSVTVPGGVSRQVNSISSAPAVVGEAGFSLSFLTPERGRRADRNWSQNKSVRKRSGSRDRSQERSTGRFGGGSIPAEGENLLERLQIFSDLYLGNSPRSHPAAQGIVTTATGLPPRPQRRQYSNPAAARQRRVQNERKKNNFTLEGSSYKDMTLRDLLG